MMKRMQIRRFTPMLLPIALAALGTLSARPAQAGYWQQAQTTVRESGEVTDYNSAATPPERRTTLTKTTIYPITGPQAYANSSQGWTNSMGAVAGTDHTFQVEMTFTWNPNAGMGTPTHQQNRLALWMNVRVIAEAVGTNPTLLTSCDGLPIPATRFPSTSFSSIDGDGLSERRSGRVLLQMDNSALNNTLTKTIVFKSLARGQGASNAPGSGSGRAYFEISGGVDERSVQISSDIEPSYFKSLSVPPPGTPVGTAGPFPAAPEAHKRNSDGSMMVDSVAQWIETPDGLVKSWYGGGEFIAQLPSFASGRCDWSIEGGTPYGETHGDDMISSDTNGDGYKSRNNHYDLTVGKMTQYYFPYHGIDLGGTDPYLFGNSAKPAVSSSEFKVTVTDSDGALGQNTYTVLWHKPCENVTEVDTAKDVRYTTFNMLSSNLPSGGVPSSDSGAIGYPYTLTIDPATIQLGLDGGIQDIAVNGGLAYVSTLGPGWGVAAAFLATAYSLDKGFARSRTTDYTNGYDHWQEAKSTFLDPPTNEGPSKSGPEPPTITFASPTDETLFRATARAMTSAQSDTYWQNSRLKGVGIRYLWRDRFFEGDHYGVNGFIDRPKATVQFQADSKFIPFYAYVSQGNLGASSIAPAP